MRKHDYGLQNKPDTKVLAGNMSNDEILGKLCSTIYRGMKRFEAAGGNYEAIIDKHKHVVIVGKRRTYDNKLIEAMILADPEASSLALATRAQCSETTIKRIRARLLRGGKG